MINNMIRKLTVGRRIFGGFLFLMLLFAMTFPFVLQDHLLLVERIGLITNVDKRAEKVLLQSSKYIESSRVNLMRFLHDYLPSVQASLNDISQASQFLTEAETLLMVPEKKISVKKVIEALASFKSVILQIGNHHELREDFEINRLVFTALKTGNDIGLQIEKIVDVNEARVAEENRNAEDRFKKSFTTLIGFYSIALLFGLILAASVGRSITLPVSGLRDGAESFRQGNTNVVIPVAGKDELSLLAKTFNQMTTEINQNKIATAGTS